MDKFESIAGDASIDSIASFASGFDLALALALAVALAVALALALVSCLVGQCSCGHTLACSSRWKRRRCY